MNIETLGLDFWMARVLRESDRVLRDSASASIHDLRVALRRCRSIADGFMTFDSCQSWEQMKEENKKLFRRLGDLRDAQVMSKWLRRIPPLDNKACVILNSYISDREIQNKKSAIKALKKFDNKKWSAWQQQLSERTLCIPYDSAVFQHLALDRMVEARQLHRQALRNRSQIAYHRLRIGLKKFRYTVENFLPALHAQWGAGLKELQDLLGEMHDLDVLWQAEEKIHAIEDKEVRRKWRERLSKESTLRLGQYRKKMMGKASLWTVWRADLSQLQK